MAFRGSGCAGLFAAFIALSVSRGVVRAQVGSFGMRVCACLCSCFLFSTDHYVSLLFGICHLFAPALVAV